MNDYIRELVQTWLEDNGRISDLATEIYDHAFEEGRRSKTWLPPVTEQQVAAWVASEPHDSRRLVRTLTEFFNDPNRDAPVKATMHPDLEWLAKQDPFSLVTNCTGQDPILYFKDDGGNVAVWRNTTHPYGKALFSRSEIELARKHLAKMENDKAEHRRERMVLSKIIDDLVGEQIPDYRLWFDIHGSETAYHKAAPFLRHDLATVHELYTHFRARLLDELRQAGVIGEE